MNYKSWLDYSYSLLENIKNFSSNETILMLSYITKKTNSYIYLNLDKNLTLEEEISLEDFLKRRLNLEPLSYILGEAYFWDLTLKVSKDTLIPRSDSETLVEVALDKLKNINSPSILDLGTGTGAIILSIESELLKNKDKTFKTLGVDFKESIIDLAKSNSKLNKLNTKFILSDWFENVNGKFDLIVSNPPYIDESDEHLKDLTYEPLSALVSKNHGLLDIFYIIKNSKNFLKNNGYLMIEHGYNQKEEIALEFYKNNFTEITNILDYNGLPRVTIGKLLI
ncbi:MAG: peptide chain release factor N(5)-glutamine methyltransferase [Psittacicella sp.]